MVWKSLTTLLMFSARFKWACRALPFCVVQLIPLRVLTCSLLSQTQRAINCVLGGDGELESSGRWLEWKERRKISRMMQMVVFEGKQSIHVSLPSSSFLCVCVCVHLYERCSWTNQPAPAHTPQTKHVEITQTLTLTKICQCLCVIH